MDKNISRATEYNATYYSTEYRLFARLDNYSSFEWRLMFKLWHCLFIQNKNTTIFTINVLHVDDQL